MKRIKGTVKTQDQILLEDIPINLAEVEEPSGLIDRRGSFQAPVSGDAAWEIKNGDGPLYIELEDGRTGEINFQREIPHGTFSVIHFKVTGKLA